MNPEFAGISNEPKSKDDWALGNALATVYWLDCLRFPDTHIPDEIEPVVKEVLENEGINTDNPMYDQSLDLKGKAEWIAQAIRNVRKYTGFHARELRQFIIDVHNDGLESDKFGSGYQAEVVMPTIGEWLDMFYGERKSKFSTEKLAKWLVERSVSAA